MAKLLEDELLENQLLESQDSFWNSHRDKIAWFILVLGLIITVLFWNFTNDAVLNDAKTRFDFRVEGVRAAIEERMMTYEQVLRSGIGFFEASSQVDRNEWKRFVDALQIDKRFPGIQGIGFALKIAPEDKEEHIRQIQAEGFLDYKIKPEGDRDVYTSIIFLEPFDIRNRQAFGYDMFSQVVRREAMVKARDSGDTAISGKVTLVQEIDEDVQSGFLVYIPLYKKGMSVDTLEQRRMALKGYVYSPFRAKDLMHGILGLGPNDIDLEVYDGVGLNKNMLMYDADEVLHADDYEQGSHLFVTTKNLNLYGHRWTLHFTSLPDFAALVQNHKSNFVIVLGGIFSLLCFLVIHGAFTTRRQALQYARGLVVKLKKNEERLSYALEATNDGLWDWNIVTDEVYFSPRLLTMLGYKPNELEGHVNTWKNLIHPNDKLKVMLVLNNHLKGHTSYYETEHRIKTKDGDWMWILDRGKVLIRDESGNPLRATGTHTDITERKEAEKKMENAQKQLIASQKLAGVGQLAAGVSHEVLNPVNIISVHAQMLQRKTKDDANIQNVCNKIMHEIGRIQKIMSSLLAFSKKSNVETVRGHLRDAIEATIVLVEEEYKLDNIKIERDWCDALVEISYDPDKIRQVYLNLINNAKHALPDGGTITVGCRAVKDTDKSFHQFAFSDTGTGMTEEVKLRIFEPFFTTKPEGEGTGMGLSVTHGIIEEHGGKIRVESQEGKGSTFIISLPLA